MACPQLEQNFAPAGTEAWQRGHGVVPGVGDAAAVPRPPMAPAIMPGIIIPMPAPRPSPAALPCVCADRPRTKMKRISG